MSGEWSNLASLRRELAALELLKPGISDSALASSLMTLAAGLDDHGPSLAMKAMAQEKFARSLADLHALAPERREVTPLDEIRARREARESVSEDQVGAARRGAPRRPRRS